jgi:hypothetical protein
MNLNLLQRVFHRYRYMKDLPVYEEFLQHLNSHGDVWKPAQEEVALWWEQRNGAAIDIISSGGSAVRVSCPLDNAVVEVDRGDLLIPPFELPTGSSATDGRAEITYRCRAEDSRWAEEVFCHLGFGHVRPAREEQKVDIEEGELTPVLGNLRNMAARHWRFEAADIERLRDLVASAHSRHSLPELRLWPLPHRGGKPFRVGVSSRYDVDKAIGTMPMINRLEARYGLRSTAYLRPVGYFYGAREIARYARLAERGEIALHGEFVTTAGENNIDEIAAASREKRLLEEMIGARVSGVCMHGGELRSNTTERTKDAIEEAGFAYETLYRNRYYLPMHLPSGGGVRKTLSIGQHYADVTAPPDRSFADLLLKSFEERLDEAAEVGGIFMPVMHPLYFGLLRYLRSPVNIARLCRFFPRFLAGISRMKKDQTYINMD